MDITYDLADPDTSTLTVSIAVSANGGATYDLPATAFTGDVGPSITPGRNKRIVWDAGKDWPGKHSANMRFRVTADDSGVPPPPAGMALIPAGSFTMGNCMNPNEGYLDELPLHTVYVSAFYMDKYLVTKALWDDVYTWAVTHGYSFNFAGPGKAANHPVQTIGWYDAVKWCNARSEREGRTPAYYTDAALSAAYKTGQVPPYVRWNAGYRLPTEAEWEKAARGGLSGHRFPLGDTISHSQANYYSYWESGHSYYSYDVDPTEGYHPTFNDGVDPYTSPVDYFAPNGYGLCDMAGNVWEWCWDWYGGYSSGSQTNPRGPATGSSRVVRGGGWNFIAVRCRTTPRPTGTAISGSGPSCPQVSREQNSQAELPGAVGAERVERA